MRLRSFHAGGCKAEGAGLEHQHTPQFLHSELQQAGEPGQCSICTISVVLQLCTSAYPVKQLGAGDQRLRLLTSL